MRYFWTHSYTHASTDGENTLCGQRIAPTPIDTSLWHEVDGVNFRERPCKKCKLKVMRAKNIESVKGKQMMLAPKPEGAVRFGKCPECGEDGWLYKWEGLEPLCEGCIDEAHDSMHEAEDAMAEAGEIDYEDFDGAGEEWGEEGEEYY